MLWQTAGGTASQEKVVPGGTHTHTHTHTHTCTHARTHTCKQLKTLPGDAEEWDAHKTCMVLTPAPGPSWAPVSRQGSTGAAILKADAYNNGLVTEPHRQRRPFKGTVHPKSKAQSSSTPLVLMKSQVKFCSPQNISGASQQNSVLHNNGSRWRPRDHKLIWKDVIYTLNVRSSSCIHFKLGQASGFKLSSCRFWLKKKLKKTSFQDNFLFS